MYKVLIVEDDPMVAMINEKYVRRNKQFDVVGSYRNGQDAVDFLEKNEVNLVILDVYMPYMDGVEMLKKIREKKISTEVIMVTAANDPQTLEETMHLGVLDFLIKPFAYERFQVSLEKFIAKTTMLKNATVLNQSSIDSIITSSSKSSKKEFPKGIQEKTLAVIQQYLEENDGFVSGDTLSECVGLSCVTVRHYMNFLVEKGEVSQTINYGTGGRPSMLYKRNKK